MKKILLSLWPYLVILVAVSIFFYPVWLKGLVPIPADFIVGVYYPWLDYIWGGYGAGVPVKNPITTDVVSFIYPMQIYAIDLLKNGVLPLWNPLILAGTPLMANFQSAPFSPMNFLYFIFSNIDAWSLQIIFQPLLGSIFLYLLLRHLQRSKWASIAGGLFYSFAGFMLIWLEWNGHSLVAAFFPLIILLTLKFLESGKNIYGILLSIVIALQIFSGYPQVILYEFLSLGILGLAFNHKWILNLKKVILLSIFICVGVGLASIQILPGLELLNSSQRKIEINENKWAFLPWQMVITFVAPDYYGNHSTYNYWGPADYTLSTGYSGVIVVILACLGILVYTKEKAVKFSMGIIALALFMAFPNPLTVAIKESGFLGLQAASAHRITVLFNLGFAILAAFGLDAILQKRVDLIKITRSLYIPIVLLFGFGIATVFMIINYGKELPDLNSNLIVGVRNLLFPTGLLILASLLLFLSLRFKKFATHITLFLILLSLFELFRFGWKFTPFSPKEFVFPKTPVLEFLQSQEKPFRVAAENVIPINMMMPYRIETIEGYDAVYPVVVAKYLAVLNSNQIDAKAMGRYGSVTNMDSPLLDLANVKYIFALKKDKDGKPDSTGEIPDKFKRPFLRQVFEDKSVVILENTRAKPRAFFIADWDVETDDQKTLAKLIDEDFIGNKKIIVKNNIDQMGVNLGNDSSVSFVRYNGSDDLMKVKTDHDGFLFISDSWYPGFKAEVDGLDVPVLQANYAFRAIPVKNGTHVVRIYYQPDSFEMGKMLSLGSGAILIFILIASHFWSKFRKAR